MHWLEGKLGEVRDLLDRFQDERYRDASAKLEAPTDRMSAVAEGTGSEAGRLVDAIDSSSSKSSAARRKFQEAMEGVAEGVCARPGITACVVAHEGLVVSQAGSEDVDEALAAMTQVCWDTADASSTNLELGEPRQMLITGKDRKIALFFVGQMVVCILSPADTVLAEALSR
ncbi:MAG: hypothetical protein DRJ42_24860 [Deltaproteobacteria bacterium]|nr:MAG: hypothetical protein DRJ42_24860 [Deltaproteobacteria bacterium]